MRRMLMPAVAALAALAVGAPVALAHRGHPDQSGPSHRGPDQGLVSAHLDISGVVAADAAGGAVQVNVLRADPDAAAALAGATTVTVKIDASTRIDKRGAGTAGVADLKAGDRVRVAWEAAVTPAAQLPAARRISDEGPPPLLRYVLRATVTGAATAAGLPVALSEGGRHTVPAPGAAVVVKLGAGVQILGRGRIPETLADLAVGDRVTLVIDAPAGASPLDFPAVAIKDGGPPRPVRFTVRGIVAADATPAGLQVGVSVANSHANAALGATGTVLVTIGPATRIHKRGVAAAGYADLKAGDRVTVAWWAPRGTALAALPAAHRITDRGPGLR